MEEKIKAYVAEWYESMDDMPNSRVIALRDNFTQAKHEAMNALFFKAECDGIAQNIIGLEVDKTDDKEEWYVKLYEIDPNTQERESGGFEYVVMITTQDLPKSTGYFKG